MLISTIKYKKNGSVYKTQRIKINCDKCKKTYEVYYVNFLKTREKHKADICKSCIIKSMQKGKTLEERLGKKKAIEVKNKLSNAIKTLGSPAKGKKWSEEQKQNLKRIRPNTGTFEEKYGKEKADEMKKKLSNKFSGENNNMYNKPSPQGSGNGWSGWYNKWYFRSLRELSYMINVIEANNQKWESCENAKYAIPYLYMNRKRNYFADFIIDSKYLIEIKPHRLINSKCILEKKYAAEKWCESNGLEYKIISDEEFNLLTNEEIKNLHDTGKIVFIDKYEQKYRRKYNGVY